MTLRSRFLIFTFLLFGLFAVFAWVVIARHIEQVRSRSNIEAEWRETVLVTDTLDKLGIIHDDIAMTNRPLGDKKLLETLDQAGMLVMQLEEGARKSAGGMTVDAEEVESVVQMQKDLAALRIVVIRIANGDGPPARADVLEAEELLRSINGSLRSFVQGTRREVDEALDRLREQEGSLEAATIQATVGAGLILLTAWIALGVGLLRPIERLTYMARRLQKREFVSRKGLPIPGGEVGELTTAFLEMSEGLSSFAMEMEQRVQLRTKELETSRGELQFMLNSLPDAVALFAADGRLLVANSAYRSLFGTASEGAVHGSAERTPQGYVRWVDQASQVRLLDVHRFASDAPGGGIVIEYARDMTRVAQAEAALSSTQRFAAMGRLSAGIAHEINNPLSGIAACAEGLLERVRSGESDPREQDEYLGTILREVYRCKSITGRLLNVSRQQGGTIRLVSVAETARECLRLVEHLFAKRRVVAEVVSVGDDLVDTNASAVHQVLLNLLLNANGAVPEGGRIAITVEGHADSVSIAVRDNGVGITPEDMPHLFEPFFTRRSEESGTGLGLFISQSLAESIGGRINVASDGPGSGAQFTLSIPRRSPVKLPDEKDVQAS